MRHKTSLCWIWVFSLFCLASANICLAQTVTGILFGEKEITVKAKSQGEITALHLDEGDPVARGAVIAIIDDRQEQIEFDQSKQEYESAKEDFDKSKKIKKYISEDELGEKEDAVSLKKSNMELKGYNLSTTKVVSPIDGVITKAYFDKGEMVSVGDKVFEVIQLDNLIAEMNVPSEVALPLRKGEKILFKTDHLKEKTFEGEISYISPVLDAASGSVKVRLSVMNKPVEDKGHLLKPGMLVSVELSKERTPSVPK